MGGRRKSRREGGRGEREGEVDKLILEEREDY